MSTESQNPDRDACAAAASVCACFNLRKASRAVSKLYDEALAPIGLRSTQFVTLLSIHVHGPTTLSELSGEMVADRSTLSRNLTILRKSGLIDGKSASGKRGRMLELTDAGRAALQQGIPLWEQVQTRFVESLGGDHWDSMLGNLARSIEAAEQS